jgi:U3 small nucleolar RNA-associated protein 20
MSEDQSEEESAIVTLLIPNMDCLLEQFRLVLLENSGEANLVITKSIPSRILSILSKLAPWVKTSSHLGGLVDIMVPFLRKPVRQVNEGAKVEILSILGEYLSMFEEGRDIEVYFNTLAGLFSSLESQKARSALVVAFKRFEGIEPKMAPLISALVDLNTYSAKRLDEPDFETKFTAFKLVASDESKFTSREWLPLVHNLLYNLRDEVEYSVRTAGVECLLRIVDLAAAEGGDVKDGALSFLDVSIYTLLPEIKKGLKFNSEVVRKEFVIVLAALIGKLPEHPRLVDMAKLLAGGDDEANFFSNVYHPQIHRRERALRRLSKECEGISSGNLNSVFIPIVSHFVFESSLIERHQLVNEAVNALSACANSLPWGHYYRLICRYFESLKKKPHLEHVVVRVVVAILESFHFKVFVFNLM